MKEAIGDFIYSIVIPFFWLGVLILVLMWGAAGCRQDLDRVHKTYGTKATILEKDGSEWVGRTNKGLKVKIQNPDTISVEVGKEYPIYHNPWLSKGNESTIRIEEYEDRN